MDYKKITWLATLILLAICVSGCGNTDKATTEQDFPDVGIPLENLNKHLRIIADPAVVSSFRKQDRIILFIENLSQTPILIYRTNDVRIFKKSTSDWEPVKNNIDYNNFNTLVPVKGGDIPGTNIIDIYPALDGLTNAVTLRIVVIGKPENLPGVTNIISSVDVTVNP